MDPQIIAKIAGWGGAILGTLIGLVGGAIGCYFSIKNTKGPRERAFMIKACVVGSMLVISLVIGLWLASGLYKALIGAAYVVVLIVGIVWCNQRQAQIRAEEARNQA